MLKRESGIKDIKGIGDKAAQKYEKLKIYTVGDLIEHYPRDYDKYERICNISDVQEGKKATIEGTLVRRPVIKNVRNLKIISIRLRDRSGTINVTWFNMPFLLNSLKMGSYYILRGTVRRKMNGLCIEQPEMLSKQSYYDKMDRLFPIYSLTDGISNNSISKSVRYALSEFEDTEDALPAGIRKKYGLLSYKKALEGIHFPENMEVLKQARRRLVFDEFFWFILGIKAMSKNLAKQKLKRVYNENDVCDKFIKTLPYELTDAQIRTWNEIKRDMLSGYVMNRIVQGDVGSGKTIVALLALLFNYSCGYEGALMVPTEVLARQHYEEAVKLFDGLDVRIDLLTGSTSAKEKKIIYEKIAAGKTDIVIGTHALLEDKVSFGCLGLVITDEQHRFGVKQRKNLAMQGEDVHVLVMSATPIPRSLALVLYGDMDMSVIDTMPKGRLPIQNCVVDTSYRQTAYRFIENQVKAGSQAYIICPMVHENDEMELENVIEYTEMLKGQLSPDIRVQSLYGSMKAGEKNQVMEAFSRGDIDVIVSTTVIEVGINVPNATVMMVENAERFGLAGLHQLRGRVGRGDKQSYCIFMSANKSKKSMERLKVLNESNDGFFIASEDLRLRGPGELMGVRQSGELGFGLADIYADASVLNEVNEAIKELPDETVRKLVEDNKRFVNCQIAL